MSSGSSSPATFVLDEDEAGPSNSASSQYGAEAFETTLVCARCLDPLVLAAPAGAPEEERKKCRVWALRCGHMLDGKCVAALITPPPPVPAEPPAEEYTGKGKGKARADPEPILVDHEHGVDGLDMQPEEASAHAATSDRKGKRKAVEPPEPESPCKRAALDEASQAQDNSIRSRLRSHHRGGPDVPIQGPAAGRSALYNRPSSPQPSQGASRRSRRGAGARLPFEDVHAHAYGHGHGRAKGKGKARARAEPKLAIEAEHEWRCPVGGCARVHYSVRVEGDWRNDEGRGGIALFV